MKRKVLYFIIFLTAFVAKAQDSRWGYALQFDGVDDYVDVGNNLNMGNGSFTIELWFSTLQNNGVQSKLIGKGLSTADQTNRGYDILIDTDNLIYFRINDTFDGTTLKQIGSVISLNDGKWHHAAGIVDRSVNIMYFYIDGILQGSTNISTTGIIDNLLPFTLGALGRGGYGETNGFYSGKMDEVRVWNTARSATEIINNRFTPLIGNEAGLIAYYKMSDGSGTSLTDDSPGTYTGTLVNGAAWVSSTVPYPYSGGIGTLGDPYQIASTTDLIYLSRHSEDWNKYFTQTADIVFDADETQVDWDADGSADGSGTAGFSPIGNGTTSFTGNYNGTGHTIRNLFINIPGTGGTTGLFGQTNGSTISNVGLIDASVTGGYDTGILAGNSSTGSISTFNNCYSTGTVSGVNNVGGLIGQLYSQSVMNNCYSLANVGGASNIGGLVGAIYSVSQANNCYSAGLVTASGTSGGLIGNKDGSSTVTDSFWDTQTSGQATSAGGTGLTTAQMKVQSNFTNWDFTTAPVWNIQSGTYISYPYLQGFTYDAVDATTVVNTIPGLEDARMILIYTVTAGAKIGLPLDGTVNVSIDWGDGSSAETQTTAGYIYHTYTNAGTYTVKISGTLTHFGNGILGTDSHPEYLTSVTSFGSVGLSSLASAFKGATNLTDVPNTLPASVTSLSHTFQDAAKINDADISSWKVSQVTDMSGLFFGATIFNQPIGSWDVSNVLNMYQMFAIAHAFNQDITSWNVANVTNMSNMFYEAQNFNQAIGSWNVGNVTDMSGMFSWAGKFNQNIGSWDVSKVTNMSWMFSYAGVFNQNISSWNVGNVTNMASMLTQSALSTTNYDALLNGWAALALGLKSNVTLSAGPYYTSAAVTARQSLTGTYNWTITDAGLLGSITSITASEASPCAGTSITLTAAGTLTGCTVHWYTASCDGTEITTGLSGTYKEVLTVSPTATTTYYAKTEIGGSYSADCVSKEISVVPPLIYRSKQTGSWTTTTNWEQYDGSAWVAASSYPGEITNACANPMVTIQATHLMEISASISIPNLEIKNTGKLTLKTSGKLTVSGQLILEQNAVGAIVKE